jgi:hypothetical protein
MSIHETANARPFGYVSEITDAIKSGATLFIRERHADRYDLTPVYIRSFRHANDSLRFPQTGHTTGRFNVGYETIYGVQTSVSVTVADDETSFSPDTIENSNGRTLYVPDANADEKIPLTPLFGTQYNIGFILQDEGLNEDTVKTIEGLLRDYFGPQLRLGRIKSREVPEEFQKVGKFGDDLERTSPVLRAEISYLSGLGSGYSTIDVSTPKYLPVEPYAAQEVK